jgi:1-acyl-sn-glycerol-3-phosphate acyltransferase
MDPVYPSRYIKRDEDGELNMDAMREFARDVRNMMQAEIDKRHGSSDFFRGRMKRIRGLNDGA